QILTKPRRDAGPTAGAEMTPQTKADLTSALGPLFSAFLDRVRGRVLLTPPPDKVGGVWVDDEPDGDFAVRFTCHPVGTPDSPSDDDRVVRIRLATDPAGTGWVSVILSAYTWGGHHLGGVFPECYSPGHKWADPLDTHEVMRRAAVCLRTCPLAFARTALKPLRV
ncbi:MAG: hypothetical protein K2V38_28835, partial [Gemmataceae bacterium]|nr:hypothetical protein [Gemmataceae bacterium]